jgi:hypothetical protein
MQLAWQLSWAELIAGQDTALLYEFGLSKLECCSSGTADKLHEELREFVMRNLYSGHLPAPQVATSPCTFGQTKSACPSSQRHDDQATTQSVK